MSHTSYAFLAGLAYTTDNNITQDNLNEYFNVSATDEADIVSNYRKEAGTSSHVSFKLVTVPTNNQTGTFAYVLIRGTTNNWDMLTDAQLWSAAALMQVLRELLPVGSAWTPIIHKLIDAITFVESESLQRVSFYKDTTKFVEYVKTLGYAGIAITGESIWTFSFVSGVACSTEFSQSFFFSPCVLSLDGSQVTVLEAGFRSSQELRLAFLL